ncbi:MAG: hypothetical protein KDD51_09800 [Bdellovibrionales bacterium]|nr:hypothetical protein [Bdellovibrionales bacterium]
MRLNIKNYTAPLVALAVASFFSACNSRSNYAGSYGLPNNFVPDVQSTFPNNNNTNPGIDLSGLDGSTQNNPVDFGDLGQADQLGLGNLLQELQNVNPQNEADIPQELAARLQAALENSGDAADPQAAFEIISLGGELLTACLESVEDYVPRPGEPEQGVYNGSCGGTKGTVTVTGIFQKIFRRRASSDNSSSSNDGDFGGQSSSDTVNTGIAGGLGLGDVKFKVTKDDQTGIMNVNQNGVGTVTVGNYKGMATDIASNGKPAPRMELTRPDEGSGKHLVPGCKGDYTILKESDSTNKIPLKYTEAMKIVGQCYRKGLVLFTPSFQRLFRNMDPQLRRLIQLRLIGIQ